MSSSMAECRVAMRRLRRAPGFAVAVVLTIAIAVGANSVVFSAVRGLLLKPLPVADGDRLVWMFGNRTGGSETNRGAVFDYEANELARHHRLFASVAVIGDRSFVRHIGDRRDRWRGLWVTPSLFDVLGVQPAAGRAITLDDARKKSAVMLISHERWTRDLGADTTVLGRRLDFIDGKSFVVVGVLPPGLEFPFGRSPRSGNGTGYGLGVQDFWILGQEGDGLPGGSVIARLHHAISAGVASSEASRVPARFAAVADRTLDVVPIRGQALGLVRPGLRLAQAFAVLMLMLACANLTNLVLLRVHSRDREHAVAKALGAPRFAIAKSILMEVSLLAVAGGTLGLVCAVSGRRLLHLVSAGSVPMLERVDMDWSTGAFTFAATALVAVLVSCLPGLVAARTDSRHVLAGAGRGQTTDRATRRLRAALVASQVALALVLSIGGALVARSFLRLMSVDTGYDPRGVIVAEIEVYDHPQVTEYYRQLHRRLLSIPGVEAAGIIHSTPLTGKWTFADPFEIVGQTSGARGAPSVAGSFVAFDYFDAMRIPLVAGRRFTPAEYLGGNAPVLIINESAARRFFPDGNVLGQFVKLGKPRRIVGVVKDSRDVRLDAEPEPTWYQPAFGAGNQLVVRVRGDASAMVERVRSELVASDRRLVVERIQPFGDIIASTVTDRRMAMRLLVTFAGLAIALAGLGLYAVLTFGVRQRLREIGVRIALGAPPSALVVDVVRNGLTMSAIGVGLGLVVSILTTRMLRSLLYDVSATDPLTIVAISGFLLLVSVAAAWHPAWRASRVDPATTLRAD